MGTGARREEQFRRIMARRGIMLVRPARPFRFTHTSYRPDFFSPTENIYYEVLGSRQRAQTIRPQLDLMELVYPRVKLVTVAPDGAPYDARARLPRSPKPVLPRWERALRDSGFGQSLTERMQREGLTLESLAGRLKCSDKMLREAIGGVTQPGPWRIRKMLREFTRGGTD